MSDKKGELIATEHIFRDAILNNNKSEKKAASKNYKTVAECAEEYARSTLNGQADAILSCCLQIIPKELFNALVETFSCEELSDELFLIVWQMGKGIDFCKNDCENKNDDCLQQLKMFLSQLGHKVLYRPDYID